MNKCNIFNLRNNLPLNILDFLSTWNDQHETRHKSVGLIVKQCFGPLFSLPTPFLLTFLHPPCSSFPLFHSLSSNNNSKLTSWLLMFQAAPTYSNCLFFYSQLLICPRYGVLEAYGMVLYGMASSVGILAE